jgi:hypothetical protein
VQNKTKTDLTLETGRRHVAVVEVTDGRLRAWVDGQVIVDLATDYHEFTPVPQAQYQPRDPARLALCVWNSPTHFHRVEVVEVTGAGRPVR